MVTGSGPSLPVVDGCLSLIKHLAQLLIERVALLIQQPHAVRAQVLSEHGSQNVVVRLEETPLPLPEHKRCE